jgi:hypothetical protein
MNTCDFGEPIRRPRPTDRADVVAAVRIALSTAEGWRRPLVPEPGAPWNATRSRELDAADDAILTLRTLAAGLAGTAP